MVDQFEPEGGKVKTGEPGYRVFCFMEEITQDVVNIQTTWSVANLSCTITVANLNNKYVITKENTQGTWKSSETTKRRIYELKNDDLFRVKVKRTKPTEIDSGDETKANYEVTGQYEEWVWDLYEGDSIFNCGDPIKVFVKDPFSDDWYWGFCGYLTPVTDTYDAETGKRTLTFHCEDTKRWVKQTRLKFGVWGNADAPLDAIYPDEVKEKGWRTVWNEAFAGYTLEQIFTALLTGQTEKGGVGDNIEQQEKVQESNTYTLRGCGGFDQSFGKKPIVSYINSQEDMKKIQEDLFRSLKIEPVPTTDEEGNIEQFTSEGYRSAVQKEIERLGTELLLGKDFSRLLVEGEIRLIIPEFFKGFENVIPHKIKANIGFSDSFKTRLTILEDVATSLDFLFYALPNGDVVLEFPQYDFIPKWYGEQGEEVFTVDEDEVTKWDFTERDDEIVTLWYIGGTVNTWDQNVDTMSKIAGSWAGAARPELVPRFGWRARVTDKGLISTQEGCEAYANMLLNKTIADTKSMEVTCTPKFQAWIARPYKIWGKNFLGFCTQVTHTIFWGQQIRTSVSLNYLRGENWRKPTPEGEDAQYDAIGGNAGGGIFNYADAFKERI